MGLDSVTVATQDGKGTVTQDRVVLRDSTGSIFQVALDSILSLTPTDDSTNEDLDFYTLTSREEARVRDLRVRVSDGDSSRKVELGYLVPAARWGVKYDLTYSEGSDTATLTPWAIAHNPLDEALEGVTLRLATGSPTSFQTNLHEPKVPARATLQEDLNVQAPTVYRAEAAPVAVAAAYSSHSRGSMRSVAFESTRCGEESVVDSDLVGESDTQAEVEDTGEETEFVLTDVNLPPTSAVTLPLTRRDLPAEIRRVWRQETGPNPDMAVKLMNSRDMVLEKGAVTIRVGDKFVGQAVLPYTPKAGVMTLAYAKDKSLRVSLSSEALDSRVTKVSYTKESSGYLLQEGVQGIQYTVEIRSLHTKPVEVLVEIGKKQGYTLAPVTGDAITVRAESESHYRLMVTVPPGANPLRFTVKAFAPTQSQFRIQGVDANFLAVWTNSGVVPEKLREALEGFILAQTANQSSNLRLRTAKLGLEEKTKQEDSLIAKIKALGTDAPTVKIRYTNDLETLGVSITESREEVAQASKACEECQAKVSEALKSINDLVM